VFCFSFWLLLKPCCCDTRWKTIKNNPQDQQRKLVSPEGQARERTQGKSRTRSLAPKIVCSTAKSTVPDFFLHNESRTTRPKPKIAVSQRGGGPDQTACRERAVLSQKSGAGLVAVRNSKAT
jgi:hypothetical protein